MSIFNKPSRGNKMYWIAKNIHNSGSYWTIEEAQIAGNNENEKYNIRLELDSNWSIVTSPRTGEYLAPRGPDNLPVAYLPEGALNFWKNTCQGLANLKISSMDNPKFALYTAYDW